MRPLVLRFFLGASPSAQNPRHWRRFVTEVLRLGLIDEIIKVLSADTGTMARILAREEGILATMFPSAVTGTDLEVAREQETGVNWLW